MKDKDQFTFFEAKDKGSVTFGDNANGKIIGIAEIGNPQTLSIDHVLLVNRLKYNLLSISQLCDIKTKQTLS